MQYPDITTDTKETKKNEKYQDLDTKIVEDKGDSCSFEDSYKWSEDQENRDVVIPM